MQITFNHEILNIEENITIKQFLAEQNIKLSCFAVMLNSTFVSKNEYINTKLKNADVLDIIQPMQGG